MVVKIKAQESGNASHPHLCFPTHPVLVCVNTHTHTHSVLLPSCFLRLDPAVSEGDFLAQGEENFLVKLTGNEKCLVTATQPHGWSAAEGIPE